MENEMTPITETYKKIINQFGAESLKFIDSINYYNTLWGIYAYEIIDYQSPNVIFYCKSNAYGDCVFKINTDKNSKELNILLAYSGTGMCKVYEYNKNDRIFLMQRIIPGTKLSDINVLEERANIFLETFYKFHIDIFYEEDYQTYQSLVDRICIYINKNKSRYIQLCAHISLAKKICDELCITYNKKCLLHGDLHHDNILLNEKNEYVVIDPKGLIGDPVFDLSRFILNELEYTKFTEFNLANSKKTIEIFSEKLNMPKSDLCKLFYIETAMGFCWSVEDGDCDIDIGIFINILDEIKNLLI